MYCDLFISFENFWYKNDMVVGIKRLLIAALIYFGSRPYSCILARRRNLKWKSRRRSSCVVVRAISSILEKRGDFHFSGRAVFARSSSQRQDDFENRVFFSNYIRLCLFLRVFQRALRVRSVAITSGSGSRMLVLKPNDIPMIFFNERTPDVLSMCTWIYLSRLICERDILEWMFSKLQRNSENGR